MKLLEKKLSSRAAKLLIADMNAGATPGQRAQSLAATQENYHVQATKQAK